MGFTSKYEGTDRIELGDGYWVEVKKCLTWAESNDAEKAGLNFNMSAEANGTGNQQPRTRTNVIIDPEAKAFEQVLASIVDWNLDDDDPANPGQTIPWDLSYDRDLEKGAKKMAGGQGSKWKSPLRRNLERMPKPAYDAIQAHVGKANEAPSRKEAAQFPNGNGSGPTDGDLEAPDDHEVLSGAGLSLETGDQGRPPSPD